MHHNIQSATVAACFSVVASELIEQLIQRGIQVVGFGRAGDRQRAVTLEQRYPGKIRVVLGDMESEEDARRMVGQAVAHLGRIDSHYHCCGVYSWSHWREVAGTEIQRLFSANFTTAWSLSKALIPAMQEQQGGSLMFVSARDTRRYVPAGFGPYMASKLALNGLVESLAAELVESGVTVNAVLPTIIDTSENRRAMPDADPASWVDPAQLASIMIEMSQPDKPQLTGALIPVNGRMV